MQRDQKKQKEEHLVLTLKQIIWNIEMEHPGMELPWTRLKLALVFLFIKFYIGNNSYV